MLFASFLAGSFFPFSSEAVMLALQAAGLEPLPLVIYATIGNTLGSYFNYGVGRMANSNGSRNICMLVRRVCRKPNALWEAEER